MKSKCSFILKASTALVLALLMLFGTVATSVAAAVQNEPVTAKLKSDSVGTPFRDADGTTKVVIYYDDTYSNLSELDGFEDLYFIIVGDTYYRGYKMTDMQKDNMFVTCVDKSYDDAKMIWVMAVDKDWAGESSEAVGAPFEKNVKKLSGVLGYTEAYKDDFVFETTDANRGHAYRLNTTEEDYLTLEINDIGISVSDAMIPAVEAETVADDAVPAEKETAAPADTAVEVKPAEQAEEASEDTAADEDVLKPKKSVDLADTGADVDLADTAWDASYSDKTKYHFVTNLASSQTSGDYSSTQNSFYFDSDGYLIHYLKNNYDYKTLYFVGDIDGYWYRIETNNTTLTQGNDYYFKYTAANTNTCTFKPTGGDGYYKLQLVGLYDDDATRPKTIKFKYSKATTYTVSYNKGANGSGTNTSDTKVERMSLTLKGATFTRTGYTQDGWSTTDGGPKTYNLSANYTSNSAVTLYPHWKANEYTITYKDGGNTSFSGTHASGYPTKHTYGTATTLKTATKTGYTFGGWYTDSACTTATNGTLGATSYTANITLYAKWTENKGNIALTATTNGSSSTTGGVIKKDSSSGSTVTSTGANSVGISTKYTAYAAPASGYSFIGWTVEGSHKSNIKLYTNSDCTTAYSSGGTQQTIYIKTDGTVTPTTSTAIVKAHFQKNTAHYISIYNTTTFDRGHWVVLSSPPQTVKVTNPAGKVTTYTYAGGTKAQRGENTVTSGGSTDNTKTATGTYYEGNKLRVYAGDKIEMTYSALASSDIISGVFYNNSIRYTTELEDDNLFCLRTYRSGGYGARDTGSGHSYHDLIGGAEVPDDDVDYFYDDDYGTNNGIYDGHALYANANYYKDATAEIISAQTNYAAAVDEDVHTVTWTAGDQDYLNIDIELASKKQVHFSDTVNTVINSIHTDNYYTIGEDVSPGTSADKSLSIKAKGDSTQTNTITKANIKFYYCDNNGNYINPATGKKVTKANRVELTGSDATLKVEGSATSIANNDAANSTSFYYIDGTMPATDVMVDLDLTVTYTLKLRSKIQSDTIDSKTGFGQVATLQIGSTSKTANNSYTSGYQIATGTCNSGDNITLKASSITSGYMFVGWFEGTSSAPDLSKEPLSRSATFSYKPTKSVDVWAVGTRTIYINGSRYLFSGSRTDWQNDNVEMKYDPEKQLYYHEIDATIFAAASNNLETKENTNNWVGDESNNGTGGNNYGYKQSGSYYYWMSTANSEHGVYFQIIDVATGHSDNSKKTVWGGVHSFKTNANGITVGKAYFRGSNDGTENDRRNGQGFIDFSESRYPGYSTPLRIYFNPENSALTAEATPIYPHIHLSDGYKNVGGNNNHIYIKDSGGTWRANNTSSSTTCSGLSFEGSGWDPHYEGHVSDILFKQRNAYVNLYKQTDSSDYKISAFVVYNMTTKKVKAYTPTRVSNNTYYCENAIKTTDDDRLYIVPVIEYCGTAAKITVVVDSSNLDYKQWGDIVSCYAWGSSGDKCGAYPGQMMVPSDDGGSWKATFPAANLTGILFSNYFDKGNKDNVEKGYTFLAMDGILSTVTYGGSGTSASPTTVTFKNNGYINQYNYIESGDYNKYSRGNCKVQTYDYREPVAYYNNQPAGASSTVLTFALKSGNSNLLSRSHADLKDVNILTLKKESTGAATGWSALSWEYLTDSTGTKYSDLNGYALPDKPTASFYIAAKAMVTYKDKGLKYVFKTGKEYDSITSGDVSYTGYKGEGATGEVDMNFAVEWYIYDASGKYITSVLSAGFADLDNAHQDMSLVTQKMRNLGYAVEGRSVKICYDKPRYCYANDGEITPGINSGSDFDVYRFTGQWYMDNEYKTAKVYAKVGIMTDNGENVAESSSAGYGTATVNVNNALCSVAGHSGSDTTDEGIDYGYTTIVDGDKGAITLTASETNFIGWDHYNSDKELELDTKDLSFRPNYSTDSTYIAMYEAKVNYSYKYIGREGGTKAYGVGSNTHLDEDEIAAGNKVKTDSTHITEAGTLSPGTAGIGIFKKTVTFRTPTVSDLANPLEYVLDVKNATITDKTYKITAKYRDASGNLVDYITPAKKYNESVDLTVLNGGNALTNRWSGHNFIGWYEYKTPNTVGQLLSTQANYGMVMVKQQTIVAVYEGDTSFSVPDLSDTNWHAYVDDNEVNYEKTSANAGTVYNDAIIRVRKNDSNTPTLGSNGKVGMIIVDDGGTNQTISTEKLAAYAKALKTSGKTGNVSVSGGTARVTNFFTSASNVNNFGRADFAAKYSFGSVSGHKYQIYAYYYDGTTYHFNTTATTGTYN